MILKKFFRDERAATVVEYGLIVAVLSLAILGSLNLVMNAIHNNFNYTSGIIENSANQ